jgi:hypothetical protein
MLPALGVTVALEETPRPQRQAQLAILQKHAFAWVRQRFDWRTIEPSPGVFTWSASDALIDDLLQSQLTPLILLDGSPAWAQGAAERASSHTSLAPPQNPLDFARFCGEFAQRYGEQLRFYQIWNEPNIAPHWGKRHIEPVEYAQLLKVASQAIRQVDADAVIVSAALAPTLDRGHLAIDEIYYLQRLYAAGAAPYFDVLAVQPFGFGSAPDEAPTVKRLNFQRAALIHQTMVRAGDGATPVWAVRFGWNVRLNSPWGTVTPQAQSRFAGEAIDLARQQWPWLTALGWTIDRPNAPAGDPIWGFALNERLRHTIQEAQRQAPRAPSAPTASQVSALALFLASLALIGWRMWAAFGLLYANVTGWLRRQSPLALASLWGLLIASYYLSTWPPVTLWCWGVAALLLLAHPQIGLWLAAFTLPFYFQHKEIAWADIAFTVAPAVALSLCLTPALALAGFTCLRGVQRQTPAQILLRFSPFDWLAIAWLGINLLPAANVWQWPAYGRGLLETASHPLLLYLAVRLWARQPQEQQRLLAALLAGGVAVALMGGWQWINGGGSLADGVRRLVGPYYSANHAALYLERTLFVGVGLFLSYRLAPTLSRDRRALLLCSNLLIAGALWLTASRGALLLGVPFGAIVLLGALRSRQALQFGLIEFGAIVRRKAWWILGIGAGLVASLGWLGLERIANRASLDARWVSWQAGYQLWRAFPLNGVGPGGFFWNYPAFLPLGQTKEANLLHPHNVWLEFMTMWGVAGLLWLLGLLAALWLFQHRRASRSGCVQRSETRSVVSGFALQTGLIAALAAAFIHAQVDAFMILPDLAAWNWLAGALLLNLDE